MDRATTLIAAAKAWAPAALGLPAGYNLSWFCKHSMMPLADGCATCDVPAPGSGTKKAPAGTAAGAAAGPSRSHSFSSHARPSRPPPVVIGATPSPAVVAAEHALPSPMSAPPHDDESNDEQDAMVSAGSTAGFAAAAVTTTPPKPKPSRPPPASIKIKHHTNTAAVPTPTTLAPPDAEAAPPSDGHSPEPAAAKPKPGRPPPASVKIKAAPHSSESGDGGDAASDEAKPHRPPPPPVNRTPTAKTTHKHPSGAPDAPPPALPPRPAPGHPLFHYMIFGPRAEVLYAWAGEQAGDLSLAEGHTVKLTRWVSPEWLEGSDPATGAAGRFPVAFVDVVEDVVVSSGPRARVLHDFEAEHPLELSVGADEVVELLAHCDVAWLRGSLRGQTGCFPAAFVEVIEDVPDPSFTGLPAGFGILVEAAAPAPDEEPAPPAMAAYPDDLAASPEALHGLGTCTFDYESATDGDLSLKVGDRVELLAAVGADWLRGRCGAREGLFPRTFVDVILEPPAEPPAKPVAVAAAATVAGHAPSAHHTATTVAAAAAPEPATGLAVVEHAWAGETGDDLGLPLGAKVTLLEAVGAEWCAFFVGSFVFC